MAIVDAVAIAVGIVRIGAVDIGFVVVEQAVAVTVWTLVQWAGRNVPRDSQAWIGDGRRTPGQQQWSGREECHRRDGYREAPQA
ncbi:hypothetical protein [Mycobacterium sp. JS623]|uniref:hypothetical protein n=1 Tax=Mycobacterium sp. JS623 TaxID=212767 RepID=UPI0003108B8A|nr:hypothetical protein [Mycobacterium sp. JS623]